MRYAEYPSCVVAHKFFKFIEGNKGILISGILLLAKTSKRMHEILD